MTDCERAAQLIPWYVAGSLPEEEIGELAMHLATCDACRTELARVVPLALDIKAAIGGTPGAPPELRERVMDQLARGGRSGVDVGSFLLGLSLGLSSARGRGVPLEGDLRILGRKVPLFRLGQGGDEHDR
jgi:anti-sigma factor RsiW